MKQLTHLNKHNKPSMVDVSVKATSKRMATAQSIVRLPQVVWDCLNHGEINSKKGPVFTTATIAGVMAAKQCANLIPFCHPLMLDDCHINCEIVEKSVRITCSVSCTYKTGVEMEALTGATVAALTIYDMCKALSHDIVIEQCLLVRKSGGKSDYQHLS